MSPRAIWTLTGAGGFATRAKTLGRRSSTRMAPGAILEGGLDARLRPSVPHRLSPLGSIGPLTPLILPGPIAPRSRTFLIPPSPAGLLTPPTPPPCSLYVLRNNGGAPGFYCSHASSISPLSPQCHLSQSLLLIHHHHQLGVPSRPAKCTQHRRGNMQKGEEPHGGGG